MTLQDWGAIGEMVGALAVVVTLIYLAKQIRQNTHAMEEGRRLALAQTYQMRSDALQAMLVQQCQHLVDCLQIHLLGALRPRIDVAVHTTEVAQIAQVNLQGVQRRPVNGRKITVQH